MFHFNSHPVRKKWRPVLPPCWHLGSESFRGIAGTPSREREAWDYADSADSSAFGSTDSEANPAWCVFLLACH